MFCAAWKGIKCSCSFDTHPRPRSLQLIYSFLILSKPLQLDLIRLLLLLLHLVLLFPQLVLFLSSNERLALDVTRAMTSLWEANPEPFKWNPLRICPSQPHISFKLVNRNWEMFGVGLKGY